MALSKLLISNRASFKCLLQLSVVLIQVLASFQARLDTTDTNQTVIARASETLAGSSADHGRRIRADDQVSQQATPLLGRRRELSLTGEGEEKRGPPVGEQSVTSRAARSSPDRTGGRDKRQAQQDKFEAVPRQLEDADGPPTLLEKAGANLTPGSRVVATSAGQSVELTCNALDAALSAASSMEAAANQRGEETPARRAGPIGQLEFVVSPNGSLAPLGQQLAHSFAPLDRANRTLEAQLLAGLLDVEEDSAAGAGSLSRHLKHLNVHDYLVALVFWYKDSNPAPIYTLDARPVTSQVLATFASSGARRAGSNSSGALEKLNEISQLNGRLLAQAKHYRSQQQLFQADERQTDGRLDGADLQATHGDQQHRPAKSMSISLDWPLIRLRLEPVEARHAGDFKCRVDFRRARTIRQLVRLLVEVPMKGLELNYSSAASDTPSDRNQSASHASALANNTSAANEAAGESRIELGRRPAVRIVRLNEGERVNFECRAIDGAPRAQLSWLVAWPQPAAEQSLEPHERPIGGWLAEQPLDLEANSTIWLEMGANRRAGPSAMEPRDNWLNRSAKSAAATDRAAPQKSANGIGLELERLARAAHRLRLGCRARQVLQFSHSGRPTNSLARRSAASDARSEQRPTGALVRGANYQHQPTGSQEADLLAGWPAGADRNNWQWARKPQDDHEARRKRSIQSAASLVELSEWVELELNLKPELVEILHANMSVAARRRPPDEPAAMLNTGPAGGHPIRASVVSMEARQQAASFVCRAQGSLPAARLQWLWLAEGLEPQPIESGERVRIFASSRQGGSESELVFVGGLGAEQHLRTLVCRATNHQFGAQISGRSLEARLKLDVKFKPIVRLVGEIAAPRPQAPTQKAPPQMQADETQLKLRCNVQSNPAINQLVWLVNGRTLARVALINKASSGAGASESSGQKYGRAAKVELFDQADIKQFRLELDRHQTSGDKDERSPAPLQFEQEQVSYQLDLAQLGAHSGAYLNFSLQLDVKWVSPHDGRQMGPNERSQDKIKLAAKWAPAGGKGIAPHKDIQFECSASNELAQEASDTLTLPPTFDDSKCLRDQRHSFVAERAQLATRNAAEAASAPTPARLLDSIEAHQRKGSAAVERLVCHRRVPTTHSAHSARFLWSFVPAERVTLDSEGHLGAASIERQVETNSSELVDVRKIMPADGRGLILCQEFVALRDQWQPAPCIILVSASTDEESHVPDVRKCQLEPLLVGPTDEPWPAPARGQISDASAQLDDARRLAISLDCAHSATGSEALILAELAVGWPPSGRRKEVARDNQKGDSWWRTFETFALFKAASSSSSSSSSSTDRPAARGRPFQRLVDFGQLVGRLLAAGRQPVDTTTPPPPSADRDYATRRTTTNEQQRARQQQTGGPSASGPSLREPVERKRGAAGGELDKGAGAQEQQSQLQGDEPADELNGRLRRQSLGANETSGQRMTLSEQVALLNELEFTLRLGDLIHAPGAARTIKGAEMKLVASTNQEQQQQQREEREELPDTSSGPVGQWAKAGGVAQVSRSASQLGAADELDEPPAPTLVASEGAPANLSLGSHRANGQSYNYRTTLLEWGRRHEIGITLAAIGATLTLSLLTLTLIVLVVRSRKSAVSPPPSFASTTTCTTSAGANAHANNTNSSPSNSNETNSAASLRACHQQDQRQHEHQLRHFLLATGADPAPSSVSSYSSPAPVGALAEFAGEFIQAGEPTFLAPCERGQPRLLDLRHFQPAPGAQLELSKQLVFDCDGLLVMGDCSAGHEHEHEDLECRTQASLANFYPGGYNLNSSLQESCTSVTETTVSPTTIDFLAPPATSCHSNQSTMRRNQQHHQSQRL